MSQLFTPSTPLETLIHRGDYQGTLEHLRSLSASDLQRHRASIKNMIRLMWDSGWKSPTDKGPHWGTRSSDEQNRAAAAAILLCGTAQDVAEARLQASDIIALSREFELPCLPSLADALLQRSPHMIRLVQELIVAGVVVRPDSEAYTLGLIALPRFRGKDVTLADYFAADPGLNEAVLRMFDIQGTAEECLASADKYNSAATWTNQLLDLCRSGVLARATLIDKSLCALEQDWPQYRAGWFSRFHTELAPTVAELQANAQRYLHLCHSRIPPTVSLALDALARLEAEARVDSALVPQALRPVFANGSKGQIELALKLVERCLVRAPTLGVDAALIACAALVQEAPALQAKILKQLSPYADDVRVREALQRHLPVVAASNRGTMMKLLGSAQAPVVELEASAAPTVPLERVSPTAPQCRLEPVRDHDTLIQLIAYVFENDADIDAFERALDGLVVAALIAAPDLPRFAPVLKRTTKLRKPVAIELARLLVFVCQGTRLPAAPVRDGWGEPSRVHAQLIARSNALMDLAAQGKQVSPLSSPTHRRGVIAPDVLISRLQAHVERKAMSWPDEQVRAILRLAPVATETDRQRLRAMPDVPFVRALRYALGDDIVPGKETELFCAAARIRHPENDDATLLAAYGDLGPDGPLAARYAWEVKSRRSDGTPTYWFHDLVVRTAVQHVKDSTLLAVLRHPSSSARKSWGDTRKSLVGDDPALVAYWATLVPSDLEAFFAEGARELGNNLDWSEARWQHKEYLQPLLDATVRPGAMGTLLLACALAGKEPGQTALSIDCFVRLHGEGRLDVSLFAETLARLLATPLVKAARYRKSFDAALRIEPGLADTTIDLLVRALIANAKSPPKDSAKLLELVHELLLVSRRRLSEDERNGIAAIDLGAAGKSIQKRLLALERIG